MNAVLIFELIAKGVALLPALVDAGINITQRVQQISRLAKGGAEGTLTDDELAKIRANFDADLDEFNKPIE